MTSGGGELLVGHGYYNQHSSQQHLAAQAAFGLWQRSIDAICQDVSRYGPSFYLVDYGSAQGANSVEPLRRAVTGIRRHERSPQRPIIVLHVDMAANDWTSLFELAEDPRRTYRTVPDVFTLATGHSFYEQVLPSNSAALGWCSTAAHWQGGASWPLDNHLFAFLDTSDQQDNWVQGAAARWEQFLAHRCQELRPGGELVISVPIADPIIKPFLILLERSVTDAVDRGTISEAEHRRMVVPMYHHSAEELMKPLFNKDLHLVVEEYLEDIAHDPAYLDFTEHGDPQRFATESVVACRAWSQPSVMNALDPKHPEPERQAICQEIYQRLAELAASDPKGARFDWKLGLLRLQKV